MRRDCSAVIFDLDDTLIDTRGTLLPASLRRVADALGVEVARLDARGKSIDEVLGSLPGLQADERAAAARAWYSPEVPAPLDPLPGAVELLKSLRRRMLLFLVTRGAPGRQRIKIEASGLGHFFDETVIRPIEEPGNKRDDFARLLRRHGLEAERCAVVGDDPDDELRWGAELGCPVIRVPEVPLAAIPGRLRALGLL